MSGITIQSLTKRFGSSTAAAPAAPAAPAVDGVDLTIDSGELFFLLGPSGCGKTTLLRMIAGFVDPTSGSIQFDGRDVTHTPPNRRNAGMVFQSYALWPHMTVAENVAYGLNVRKVAADEKRRRVLVALRSVHMDQHAERKPNQLSGGQQQRVALARALVIEPTVLLLDEPLSNLDAKLRLEMRSEIRRICKQSGITGVYVTHDQKEALSMADRMAVLRAGKIVQVGGPRELYDRPRTRFVADFLGETNFLPATVRGHEHGATILETPAGVLRSTAASREHAAGQEVTCSVRPEAWGMLQGAGGVNSASRLPTGERGANAMSGRIVSTTYLGEVAQHMVALTAEVSVRVLELNPGQRSSAGEGSGSPVLRLTVNPEHVVILDD